MNYRLNIAIDDVNPKQGWRILGDQTEVWLRQLNEEFGVKFTLFIPSNYHGQYPISEHKNWINELKSVQWLELAAHGHYHQTINSQLYGECEFFELQNSKEILDRMFACRHEWFECELDISQMGWRNPGWLCSENSKKYIDRLFKYVALHYEHNRYMRWDHAKTFSGHDGINTTQIEIHNDDMIMFQSHIAGDHNDNVWNGRNFNQLRISLEHLFLNCEISPKLLNECL